MEIQKGAIVIEIDHDCYEGWFGYYEPENPEDEPLLRFTVYRLADGEREPIDDASYCTRLSDELPDEVKMQALELLMDQIYEPASEGHSIKKLCEQLSWIGADWFAKEAA